MRRSGKFSPLMPLPEKSVSQSRRNWSGVRSGHDHLQRLNSKPQAIVQPDPETAAESIVIIAAPALRGQILEPSDVADRLSAALLPDYIVIGGGNVEKLKDLPPKCRRGNNDNAFRGGFRVWLDDSLRL